jgi:hypothetical protein
MSVSNIDLFPESTTDISYPLQILNCSPEMENAYYCGDRDRWVRRWVYNEPGRLKVEQHVLNENQNRGKRVR